MKKYSLILLFITCLLVACEEVLDEPVYSQLSPENVFKSEQGIQSILFAAYSELANTTGNNRGIQGMEEWGTDIGWQTGGGENSTAVQFLYFTLGASTNLPMGTLWDPNYRGIRNANVVLDNIDKSPIDENKKYLFIAEAKFIRAMCYSKLFFLFGPTPLRKSENDELELQKAEESEMINFIETELKEALPNLPNPGEELAYGRAHKGAVWGALTKFYLNTKQWAKCVDAAQNLMDLNYYELFPDYEYLFHVENERNKEYIWVKPVNIYSTNSNTWMTATFPPGFAKDRRTGLEMKSTWKTIASQYRILDDFYNSFESGDKRKNLIISKYINNKGDTISLLNQDNTRSFKYWPDPNAAGNIHGNDLPQIRYADILLSKAEALNELNGPNQESIELINRVRNRAGLSDISLSEFNTKEALRAHLLKERGWEFYSEPMRRYDLIRMGKFIEMAQARGMNAQPFHGLFPIPQQAIDANPNLEQNSGY